jgi:hypothetical protein
MLYNDPDLPHVPGDERLIEWLVSSPEVTDARGRPINLPPEVLERTREATFLSFKSSTRETYGSGILDYVSFLLTHDVPKQSWLPLTPNLARAWIADRVGKIGKSGMRNALAGVHAWESINGFERQIPEKTLTALLRAADNLAPVKRAKRKVLRVETIKQIYGIIDQASPLDMAFFACLTTTFYCTLRLGEFTLPSQSAFDPAYHVTPAHIEQRRYHRGNATYPVTVFKLPWTKVAQAAGEEVYWAAQHGNSDPRSALQRHLEVNRPPKDGPLFAYQIGEKHVPLTYHHFTHKLAELCEVLGIEKLHGHSLRIGNTLEMLVSMELSLEEVKVKGRWSSDAFLRYLREHAEVLAPLIQATPCLLEEAKRRGMLPALV